MTTEEMAREVLRDALVDLTSQYMDKLINAARDNRGDDVDHAATWLALLQDVDGAVEAAIYERTRVRGAETQ